MRHAGWTHWRTGRNRLTGVQQDAARRLLGDLRRRLQLGEVGVGIARARMDDGTFVEAAWYGAIPVVRVIPVEGAAAARDRTANLKTQLLVWTNGNAGTYLHRFELGTYALGGDTLVEVTHAPRAAGVEVLSTGLRHIANLQTAYRSEWYGRFRSLAKSYWVSHGRGWNHPNSGVSRVNAATNAVEAYTPTSLANFEDPTYEPWQIDVAGAHMVSWHENGRLNVWDSRTMELLGSITGATAVGGMTDTTFSCGDDFRMHPSGRWGWVPLEAWLDDNNYGAQGLAVLDLESRTVHQHFAAMPQVPGSFLGGANFGSQAVGITPTWLGDAVHLQGVANHGTEEDPDLWDRVQRWSFDPLTAAMAKTREVDYRSPMGIMEIDPRELAYFGSIYRGSFTGGNFWARQDVYPIGMATDPFLGEMVDSFFPRWIGISPDGAYAYVVIENHYSGGVPREVAVIDVVTGLVRQRLPLPNTPEGALRPDGAAMLALPA